MVDLALIVDKVKPELFSAGDMIVRAWEKHTFAISKKDARDVVTETDVAVEEFLRKKLADIVPEAGFIVEEGTTDRHAELNWTIDPIDGTKYFANQAPMFFTQISLLDSTQNPLVSFVYNPISRQLFHAVKGVGSYLNGVVYTADEAVDLGTAIVHFDMGFMSGSQNDWKLDLFNLIASQAYRARFTAGFLVPYMLTGAIHLSVNTDVKNPPTVKNITDLAPHRHLLLEAGYAEKAITFKGNPVLLWGTSSLIQAVHSILAASE